MRQIFAMHFVAGVMVVLLATAASAQLSDRQQAELAERYRQSMGLTSIVAKIKAGEVDGKRLAILRAILIATPEVQIHRQRGAAGNKIYLHPDGHQEAVYDRDGQLVSDGINDGSYNYFHPTADAARHYLFDIHPWILMGSSRQDPTTPRERVSSYMSDFEFGIVKAAKSGDFPPIDLTNLREGEAEAYAIFFNALEAGDANELFAAVGSQKILDDQSRSALLEKFERIFQEMYAK